MAVFAQYGEIVDVNLVRDQETGKLAMPKDICASTLSLPPLPTHTRLHIPLPVSGSCCRSGKPLQRPSHTPKQLADRRGHCAVHAPRRAARPQSHPLLASHREAARFCLFGIRGPAVDGFGGGQPERRPGGGPYRHGESCGQLQEETRRGAPLNPPNPLPLRSTSWLAGGAPTQSGRAAARQATVSRSSPASKRSQCFYY